MHEGKPFANHVVLVDIDVIAQAYSGFAFVGVFVDIADQHLRGISKTEHGPIVGNGPVRGSHRLSAALGLGRRQRQARIPTMSANRPSASRSAARMSARISSSERNGW